MKSKGFIAMSIVYSFFIVFISVTSLLLANYMQNRILVKSMNDDIKTYLTGEANKILYYEEILKGSDPVLTPGLVPVTIDGTGTIRVADQHKSWYDYETKQWANAVVVNNTTYRNAVPGTIIPISYITQMYVWIPRYSYNPGTIERTSNAIEITFVNQTQDAHIAFCWGNYCQTNRNNDENIELPGLWVGKFEQGAYNDIKPGINSLNGYKTTSVILGIRGKNNTNGLDSQSDIHVIKNTEWGAVAYLSQSKYGICNTTGTCSSVVANNATYTAGNNWTGALTTSTNHNLTGIYDMAGGREEIVMSNIIYHTNSASTGFIRDSLTGWSATERFQYKYYDTYTTAAFPNASEPGDAIEELYPDGVATSPNWNNDMVQTPTTLMTRGGLGNAEASGIWNFNVYNNLYASATSRSVLTPLI